MKKVLICIIAILAIVACGCTMANAEERTGKFGAGMGFGFTAGQSASTFLLQFGGDYYVTDMISINPVFDLFLRSGTGVAIVPRARFTFDIPGVDHLEAFGDAGFGFIHYPGANQWVMAFGGGAYYWLVDGHLGLGSNLDFTVSGIKGNRFNIVWAVGSVQYRF